MKTRRHAHFLECRRPYCAAAHAWLPALTVTLAAVVSPQLPNALAGTAAPLVAFALVAIPGQAAGPPGEALHLNQPMPASATSPDSQNSGTQRAADPATGDIPLRTNTTATNAGNTAASDGHGDIQSASALPADSADPPDRSPQNARSSDASLDSPPSDPGITEGIPGSPTSEAVTGEPAATDQTSANADSTVGAGIGRAGRFTGPIRFVQPRAEPAGDRPPSRLAQTLSGGVLKTVGALGVVIVVIFSLRGFIRRFRGPLAGVGSPTGVISVLARYPLGKGQTLLLLKLDRRILLVCQTSGGTSTLTEITDAEEVASVLGRLRDEQGESFNRRLEQLLQDDTAQGDSTASSASRRSLISRARSAQPRLSSDRGGFEVVDLTRPRRRAKRRGSQLVGEVVA